MKRFWRGMVLLLGLIAPQVLLMGQSLAGKKILLPLDLLRMPGMYLPSQDWSPREMMGINTTVTDLVLQHEPNRIYAAKEVRAGRLPLWNPESYCGAPFLASNQPAVFSPFRAIDYLWPGSKSIAWGRLIRMIVAGVGAYLFFRGALRVRFLPACIGAWCFPLGGFLTLWCGYPIEWTVVWLPMLLWATQRTIRRPRSRVWMALALVTACVLVSGHSATGMQMLLMAGAYAIWLLIRRTRIGAVWALVAGVFVGGLLSLPQTLPTLEYLRSSYRIAARQGGFVETEPVGVAGLPELVLPYFLGSQEVGAAYYIDRNRIEGLPAGYAGLVLTLAIAPIAWQSRRHRFVLVFSAIAAMVGAGQMLDIPILSALYRAPLMNLLRNNRLVFMTGFTLLTWAVVGLNVLVRRRGRMNVAVVTGLILALALGLLCLYRHNNLPGELLDNLAREQRTITAEPDQIERWFKRMYLAGAFWCAMALLAGAIAILPVRRRLMIVALIGAVSISELIAQAWNVNAQSDPALYYPRLRIFDEIAHRAPGRICGLNCFPAALNLAVGLPDVRGYDAADPLQYTQLLDAIADPGAFRPEWAKSQGFFPRGELPVLDLLNLRYFLAQGAAQWPGANVVWRGDAMAVLERPSTSARVLVPEQIEVIAEPEKRIARMSDSAWDPRRWLILESSATMSQSTMAGSARIVADEPARVTIEAAMQTPGFVLLADRWDAGWRATVNGAAAKIWRADHAFRAVEVPAGASTIEFRYRPDSFRYGCYGAAIAAIVLIVGAMRRPS